MRTSTHCRRLTELFGGSPGERWTSDDGGDLMAGPNLPTTATTARSIPQHVDDHNAIHGIVDKFDKDAVPTAGQSLVFNGTVYLPTAPTVFNVKAFGALGTFDGGSGADDTTAILAAVTAAQAAATAFAIYFPPLPS